VQQISLDQSSKYSRSVIHVQQISLDQSSMATAKLGGPVLISMPSPDQYVTEWSMDPKACSDPLAIEVGDPLNLSLLAGYGCLF
jgi:hypothetical protein